MTKYEEAINELNAKTKGGWLVIRYKEYFAWQIEDLAHFEMFIEAMGMKGMYDELIADIRPTELEAWKLATEKLHEQMIDSILCFTDTNRFMEAKINNLKTVDINKNVPHN